MSLDDAINAARSRADTLDASARQARERKQREQADVQAMAAEAAARLSALGGERFVRVRRAPWLQRGEIYRDPAGQRYAVAVEQRCWVLATMSGVRKGEGPWMDSPVLLLADGTIGRFWPIPPLQRIGRGQPARFVSAIDLDPVEDGLFRDSGESYVEAVERRLAAAVVSYERRTL